MKSGHSSEVVAQMTHRIVHNFNPQKIILFGSRARGTAAPDDDVDLWVIFNHAHGKRKLAVAIRQKLSDFMIGKDILVTSPDEIEKRGDLIGTLLRPALREGIVVYEKPV